MYGVFRHVDGSAACRDHRERLEMLQFESVFTKQMGLLRKFVL